MKIPAEIADGVAGMDVTPGDRRSETVMAMAHSLQLVVHAESVERPDAAQRLRQAGCTYAQGSFFGLPQDAARVAKTMRRRPGRDGPTRLRAL